LKRLSVILVLSLLTASPALAEEWSVVQKDAQHSGSISSGSKPPLKRAFKVGSGDSESSFTTWPVIQGGVVYASSGPGVLAVDAVTGKKRWWHRIPEGSAQVGPAVDDRAVYIPVSSDRLLALDRSTGTELWGFTANSDLETSPTLADGRIYVGTTFDHTFYAINASDGSLAWQVSLELEPQIVPAVADGVVIIGTEGTESSKSLVFELDASTGKELWRVNQEEDLSSPSILGQIVILGGGDFFAHALDLHTGREVWRSSVEGKFGERNMPALAFGDAFLADRIGNIYRLDGNTGKREWIFRHATGTTDQSFPVIAGKTLFIGSGDGGLYALDTDTGKLLWKGQVNGFVLSGAADAQHFYFGVKFGDEGLYAYGHDPNGKLYSAPALPGSGRSLVSGFVLFALILGVAIILLRRRFKHIREVSG
jgi:eukaryotic-like serine/threonine-protein kinase